MSDIFVFGSNRAGRHGKGAAKWAQQYYGARPKIWDGLCGNSYGIPTKSADLETLPLEDIAESAKKFLAFAKRYPDEQFNVTAIGCGLAGYTHDEILPLFYPVSENVSLPGLWVERIHPIRRIVVAGSRGFEDFDLVCERLDESLEVCSDNLLDLEIVSGTARGADTLGAEWAKSRGIPVKEFPAQWDHPLWGKAAGMVRNAEMARYGTHVIAFWDGKSPGTKAMIGMSQGFGLPVDIIRY